MTDLLNVWLVVTSGLEWPPVALLPPLNKAETERFMRHVLDERDEEGMSRQLHFREYGIQTSTACCKKQVARSHHAVE